MFGPGKIEPYYLSQNSSPLHHNSWKRSVKSFSAATLILSLIAGLVWFTGTAIAEYQDCRTEQDHDCEQAILDNRWHYAVFRMKDDVSFADSCSISEAEITMTVKYKSNGSRIEIAYVYVRSWTSGARLIPDRWGGPTSGGSFRFESKKSLGKYEGDYIKGIAGRHQGEADWPRDDALFEITLRLEGNHYLCAVGFYGHLEKP